LLGERTFGRQAFHAARAVEAVAVLCGGEHVGGVGRFGDRATVAEHQDVLPLLQRRR
jgi:hypothetical protein